MQPRNQNIHLSSAANLLTNAITRQREVTRKNWHRNIHIFDTLIQRFRDHDNWLDGGHIHLLSALIPSGNFIEFMELPAGWRVELMLKRQRVLHELLQLTENTTALSTHLLNHLARMPLLGSEHNTTWYLDTNPAFMTRLNVRISMPLLPSHIIAQPLCDFYSNNSHPELLEILAPMSLGFSGRTLIEAEGLSQLEIDQYHYFAGYHSGNTPTDENSNQSPPPLLTRVDLRLLSDRPIIGQPGQFNLMLTTGSYSIVMDENAYIAAMLLLMTLGMMVISNRSALYTMFAPRPAPHAPAAQNNNPVLPHHIR